MTTMSSLRRTPSAPAVVGYVRTAAGQSPVPQINTLMRADVAEEDIYIERTNGHKTAWPERDLLLPRLRSGDTITVSRLDRLFYSVQNLILVGTDLRNRGIRLHAVEQNIDSNTLEGRDFFGMMSVFATLHHEFVLAATNDAWPPPAPAARPADGPHDSPPSRSNRHNSSTNPASPSGRSLAPSKPHPPPSTATSRSKP
ncbi:recombinase family protein [Streptomyces europaeiscabiei]|nr:recombinase family protein [Streptomyces europaeiscabiei]MDX3697761.1 recombinase family protein [Streptomyces europaeiscabiei]